jgi:hypothetical protein
MAMVVDINKDLIWYLELSKINKVWMMNKLFFKKALRSFMSPSSNTHLSQDMHAPASSTETSILGASS